MQVVGWSFLCMGITQIYFCVMKNTGRTTRSTVYATVALVLNLVLNAVLIYGLFGAPDLGIRGEALATLLARVTELLFVAAENMRKDVVSIRMKNILHCHVEIKRDYAK